MGGIRQSGIVLGMLIAAVACSAPAGQTVSRTQGGPGAPFGAVALPSLPLAGGEGIIPAVRGNSAAFVRSGPGSSYYLKSDNASIDLNTLVLDAAPGELSWAIYGLADVDFTQGESLLTVQLLLEQDCEIYAAVPDYSEGKWVFSRHSVEPGVDPTDYLELPIPQGSPYTSASPSGDFFFAVCAWDGVEAAVNHVQVTCGIPSAAPANLSASDGTFIDHVELSWDAVPHATNYRLEFKETGADESAWEFLAYVAEGTSYTHQHQGNPVEPPVQGDSYDYRVRAHYADGDDSPFSAIDSGYRIIPPPQNFTASDGVDPTRIELGWDLVANIGRYNIYYKHELEGDDAWKLLYGYNRQLDGDLPFWHTGTFPPGEEAAFNTVYDYRVHTVYNYEESLESSSEDSGYRTIPDAQNMWASYNLYQDQVTLSWSIVPGADGYNVYRSTDGFAYGKLGETSAPSYIDDTVPDYEDYYFSVIAFCAEGGGGLADPAIGSRLGWDFSTIADGCAAPAHCDLMVLDGRLAAAFHRSVLSGILLSVAQVERPAGPADWTDTEVALGTNYKEITLDQLGGWPAVAYLDSDGEALSFAMATSGSAAAGYTFTRSVVTSGSDQMYNPRWRNAGGKPLASYRRHGSSESGIYVSYSMNSSPTQNSDWSEYKVTDVTDTCYGHALITGPSHPVIAYAESSGEAIYCAISSVAFPTLAAVWTTSEVHSTSWVERDSFSLTAVANGRPLVACRTNPDPSDYYLTMFLADVTDPAGPNDWHSCGGAGDIGYSTGHYPCVRMVAGRPAVCYFDREADVLCFAWSQTPHPVGSAEWSFMQVLGGQSTSGHCALVDLGGLPAIVFHDTSAGAITLAQGK